MSNVRSGRARLRGRRVHGRTRAATRPATRPATRLAACLAACLTVGLAGCATVVEPEAPAERQPRVVRYTVEPGDRLGLIADAFTGDAGLWRTIADLNGIADPRRMRVGQVLEIPVALIPEADRAVRIAASVAGPGTPVAGNGAEPDDAASRLADLTGRDAGAATASGRGVPRVAVPVTAIPSRALRISSAPVVISPVRTREAFELSPLDDADGAAAGERYVKVLGSYTPKGIYEAPEGQSRVLMRVTPGTVLKLERDVGGWHEVVTGAGTGYLRAEDARIVTPPGAGARAGG